MADSQGRHIHPRPTASGTLTAIVVGNGSPTHTDRDGRIRVQFPWQRGQDAGARHDHPTGSNNAPANASLGVWLRVMTPVAGANWGGHLVPRPGQEVLVAFQNGNIDRPIVIGSAYNGSGNPDAQGNRIAGGTQQTSANAPAFFAGEKDSAHTHQASLSGIKTQQLSTSQSGQGGYNQFVFDDTPGEARIELGTTQYNSTLQLGHLKQQTDNARLADRGHGGELNTQASLALRAGNGLLLSADARPNASGTQLDSREPITQTQEARNLSHSLADVAHKQNAGLKGDPAADKIPALDSLKQAEATLGATATHGTSMQGNNEGIKATLGGTGTVPAWSQPRLQFAAPAGIAQLTPEHHLIAAGQNLAIATEHDTNLIAQGNHSLAVKDGIALFTVGKASNKQKPNQETGIHLHAASGTVSVQSQGGKTTAAADKEVTIASTTGKLTASATQKILATAQGAYLKIEGGNIELHAPKKVEFKASKKDWTGPKSAAPESVNFPRSNILIPDYQRTNECKYYQFVIDGNKNHLSDYALINSNNEHIGISKLNPKGKTSNIPDGKSHEDVDSALVIDSFSGKMSRYV
ncbi:DUF2345 domain-containing protein [Dechloromonas sp. ARDL1]|uniref:DUF2345 domain-containing protein n=1 Tax=Dechloromonas sp. ARDL1 TaxID=3322121 RepID=UPI003DA78692